MLKIDLKKPCYTCELSDFELNEFYDSYSKLSILCCTRTPVCKFIGASERTTEETKKIGVKHDADCF